MKGDINIREGFELSIDPNYLSGEQRKGMYKAFGLSDKRSDELVEIIKDGTDNHTEKGGSRGTNIVFALTEIASKCHNINELVLAAYGAGAWLQQIQRGGVGGRSGIHVIQIKLGGGGGGGKPQEEEDPIEDLIKKSYEINKGKKGEEEEEG